MIDNPLPLNIILDARQDKLHIDIEKYRIVKVNKRRITWVDQDQVGKQVEE